MQLGKPARKGDKMPPFNVPLRTSVADLKQPHLSLAELRERPPSFVKPWVLWVRGREGDSMSPLRRSLDDGERG